MAFLSRIKKLASETAIYGISTIVGRLVNYLLVPLYLGFFDPDLYGIVVLVYTSFVVLNHLFQHGMESAYLKFASGEEGRGRVRKVFSTATWSLMTVAILLSLLIIGLREPLGWVVPVGEQWNHLWYYAAAILSLDALAIIPFAELRLQHRPLYFAAIKLGNILINVGLNLVLIVGFRYGIEAIFISNLAASAITFLLLLPLYSTLLTRGFDGALWKQLMLFGLPFIPSGLSYAFVDRVNVFFLGNMDREKVLDLYGDAIPEATLDSVGEIGDVVLGQYVSGIFGAVWKLGLPMMLFAQMFRFAWQPFFLQHAEDKDAPALFARIFTLFTAGSLLIVMAITFYIDLLVAIPVPGGGSIIPNTYWFALHIVPVALIAYFFQGWYYNFTAGAYIKKKTKYFVVCTGVGALVALLINVTLIPVYGMVAAAWATTAAYAVMALMLVVIVHRFYPVPYNWFAVLRVGVLAGVLVFIWYYFDVTKHPAVEFALLLLYIAGLFALRVVPLETALKLLRIRR